MQRNDIASILVECIVFPALINKRFDCRLGVVKFDSFSHFSRSIGILRWRNNSFSMVFRIIFPPGIMKKNIKLFFFSRNSNRIIIIFREEAIPNFYFVLLKYLFFLLMIGVVSPKLEKHNEMKFWQFLGL